MTPTNASVSIKDTDRFRQMLDKLASIRSEIDAKSAEERGPQRHSMPKRVRA